MFVIPKKKLYTNEMREAESWKLHVDARTNKFSFQFKAKRFFFPNLYQLSFKLTTRPPDSLLRKSKSLKSKFIKLLQKCSFKRIKNTGMASKSDSRSRCISCEGRRNDGKLGMFYNWITAEKDNIGTSIQRLNIFKNLKMFMGMNVIYLFLLFLATAVVSYWVLAIKYNNFMTSIVRYFYKMLAELI